MKLLLSIFLLTITLQAQVWFASNATVRAMNVVGVEAPVSLNTMTNGLVVSYSFSLAGPTNDSSGHNLTLTNAGDYYGGFTNYGLVGSSCFIEPVYQKYAYIRRTNLVALLTNNAITLGYWVKMFAAPTDFNFIGGLHDANLNHGWVFETRANSKLYAYYSTNYTHREVQVGANALDWTVWHHLLVVADTNNCVFYVDGQPIQTNLVTGDLTFWSDDEIFVGYQYTGYSEAKLIDEYNIWNRALTTNEIATLYNKGLGNTYPFTNSANPLVEGLFAYWPLNDTTSLVDTRASYSLTNLGDSFVTAPGVVGNAVSNTASYNSGLYRSGQFWNDNTGGTNFTLNLWVNVQKSANKGIISMYGGQGYSWLLAVESGIGAYLSYDNADIALIPFDGNEPDGNWTMTTLMWNSPTLIFYSNSVPIVTNTYNHSLYLGNQNLEIGSFNAGSAYNYQTLRVDEIGMWKRQLTTNEIYSIYTNGLAGKGYPW